MITRRLLPCAWSAAIALGIAGCATNGHDVHQFAAAPSAKVGAQDLKPAKPTATMELLKAADEAFRKGNALQEKGDREGALKEYNRFLELLIEADLDPGVFYNLRSEFGRVLNSTNQQARVFERAKRSKMTAEELASLKASGNLEIVDNDRVQAEILEIQNYYPRIFQGGLNRCGKYLPYIEEEFAKAGMPPNLVWLPMVESSFNPSAKSPAGAVGMWQFMKETGRRYNLHVDNYVDDRLNWKKETQAAIAYLRDMSERFDGNWPVAVAAYNMGEFGMERAIAAAGGNNDLWTLIDNSAASSKFQDETKKYYPRLLASITVGSNPTKYGFEMGTQSPDDCVEVPVKGSFSLAVLDRSCGLPEGTLASLNPDLIRGVTPPDREHPLVVPTPAKDKLMEALANVPQERSGARFDPIGATVNKISSLNPIGKGGLTQHMVKRGDTLSGVADQYGVTVDDLSKANKLRPDSQLSVGRRLTVPRSNRDTKAPEPAPAGKGGPQADAAPKGEKAGRTYTVKQGDTLFDIAKAEGIAVKDLQRYNELGDAASIHVGDTLVVAPGPGATKTVAAPAAPKQTSYQVKKGDTPATIAKRFNVSLDDLVKWNKLGKNPTVMLGQNLVIFEQGAPAAAPEKKELAKADTGKAAPKAAEAVAPKAAPAKAPAPKNTDKVTHTVAKGETATGIAAKYNVDLGQFLAWNGLGQDSVVKVGDQYAVYVAKKAPEAAAKADPKKEAAKPGAVKGEEFTVHTVAKGENPSTIARRYNVDISELGKWNNWTKAPTLQVGDKVKVRAKK